MLQPEQLEEIKDIIEMKVTHRRNIIKREARFGHKSNSTIGLDLGGAAANVIAPGLSTISISPVCIFWRNKPLPREGELFMGSTSLFRSIWLAAFSALPRARLFGAWGALHRRTFTTLPELKGNVEEYARR